MKDKSEAELYATTQKKVYRDSLANLSRYRTPVWDYESGLAYHTLALRDLNLDEIFQKTVRAELIFRGNSLLDETTGSKFRIPVNYFQWGSNGTICSAAMLLAYAYYLNR